MCQRARLRIAATIQVTPMKIVTTAVSMLRAFQAFARTFDVSATERRCSRDCRSFHLRASTRLSSDSPE